MSFLSQIRIDRLSDASITQQIYSQLKRSILEAQRPPGTKFPSIRGLSIKLHVNKSCVVQAYQKLSIEGLIISKPQKGFYVNATKDV